MQTTEPVLCVACRLQHLRVQADCRVPIQIDGEHGFVNVCAAHADDPTDAFWSTYTPYRADESVAHA
jgi:hypothetical protein